MERDLDPADAPDPSTLLGQLARSAAEDADAEGELLERVDTLALTPIAGWDADSATACVAEEIGASPSKGSCGSAGGEVGITLLNDAARAIPDGESRVAPVGGCNLMGVPYPASRSRTF